MSVDGAVEHRSNPKTLERSGIAKRKWEIQTTSGLNAS